MWPHGGEVIPIADYTFYKRAFFIALKTYGMSGPKNLTLRNAYPDLYRSMSAEMQSKHGLNDRVSLLGATQHVLHAGARR